MSWDLVSARLKEIMQSVDGVYNVHRYFRDIPSEEKFKDAFTVDLDGKTVITGWMMTRRAVPTERPNQDANATLDCSYNVEIEGLMGLDDQNESELLFQRAVDNLLLKFKSKFLLESESGSVPLAGIVKTSEVRIDEIGHGQFSNIFVHFCRINMTITERI